jgi:hypothetical protein
MRYALYFCPEAGSALERAASSWLGRSVFEKRAKAQPPADGLDLALHTSAPRRYGFHATIVAPFELAPHTSLSKLCQLVEGFCKTQEPFDLPLLNLRRLNSFLALTPENTPFKANALAANLVRTVKPLQAELSLEDIKRRLKSGLSQRQRQNLEDWNYPHVFEDYQLHFTLTNALDDDEAEAIIPLAQSHFRKALQQPLKVNQIALFVEHERGAAFHIEQFFPLQHFAQNLDVK